VQSVWINRVIHCAGSLNASESSCGWVGVPSGRAEHMTVGVVGVEIRILVFTVLPPGVQDLDGARVEVDRASGGVGFASRFVEFVADRHE
jgi:hypothetical protein